MLTKNSTRLLVYLEQLLREYLDCTSFSQKWQLFWKIQCVQNLFLSTKGGR
jgi:hypothetical protein